MPSCPSPPPSPAPAPSSSLLEPHGRAGRRLVGRGTGLVAKLVGLVAFVAAVVVGPGIVDPGAGLGGVEVGPSCAEAQGGTRAGLVVDFGTAPGGAGRATVARCFPIGGEATGADLLAEAGLSMRFNSAGLLCAIGGYPETGCGEWVDGSYRYWSYWHAGPGEGYWSYASDGPAMHQVRAGAVEGWRFVHADAKPTDPQPRGAASIDALCGPATTTTTTSTTTVPAPAPTRPSGPDDTGGAGAPPTTAGTGGGAGGPSSTTTSSSVPSTAPDGAEPPVDDQPAGDPSPDDPNGDDRNGDGPAAADDAVAEDHVDGEDADRRSDGPGDDGEMALEVGHDGGSSWTDVGGMVLGVGLIGGIGTAAVVGLRRSRRSP